MSQNIFFSTCWVRIYLDFKSKDTCATPTIVTIVTSKICRTSITHVMKLVRTRGINKIALQITCHSINHNILTRSIHYHSDLCFPEVDGTESARAPASLVMLCGRYERVTYHKCHVPNKRVDLP